MDRAAIAELFTFTDHSWRAHEDFRFSFPERA
jgi:hypothetical protein